MLGRLRSLAQAWRLIKFREVSLTLGDCPLCRGKRPFARLQADEIAVRCLGCQASPISLSLIASLDHWVPDLVDCHVYELSARGRVFDYLKAHAKSVTGSEYLDAVTPGEWFNGVQCQDVQALTYADGSFELCTSTEVLEHVPDDGKAMRELLRVLKPGGQLLFTVPLNPGQPTIERAVLQADGTIKHLQPPEYHSDPIRDSAPVLAFRSYGHDIVDRLLEAGFASASIHRPTTLPWQHQSPVVVAIKSASR